MDLEKEKHLWKEGYKFVVGFDEAGRGALCGPVVACAVSVRKFSIWNRSHSLPVIASQLSNDQFSNLLKEVNDSKKLSPKKREELYEILINHPFIEWGIGKVGPKLIDRINIFEATKLAMKKAIKNLNRKLNKKEKIEITSDRTLFKSGKKKIKTITFLILDGKMELDLDIPQESIIKADAKIFSCAAGSILAKVTRDRSMQGYYHKKYPQYGFDKHKGYGTDYHLKMLKKYGPCKIHRKTFKPIKKLSNC